MDGDACCCQALDLRQRNDTQRRDAMYYQDCTMLSMVKGENVHNCTAYEHHAQTLFVLWHTANKRRYLICARQQSRSIILVNLNERLLKALYLGAMDNMGSWTNYNAPVGKQKIASFRVSYSRENLKKASHDGMLKFSRAMLKYADFEEFSVRVIKTCRGLLKLNVCVIHRFKVLEAAIAVHGERSGERITALSDFG